jgi:hypothetical protein
VIDILNSTAEPFLSETELKIEEDIIMEDEWLAWGGILKDYTVTKIDIFLGTAQSSK